MRDVRRNGAAMPTPRHHVRYPDARHSNVRAWRGSPHAREHPRCAAPPVTTTIAPPLLRGVRHPTGRASPSVSWRARAALRREGTTRRRLADCAGITMTCGDCGHEPPAGSTFCNECGAKLAVTCPGCGASPPPASRFCNECGATLGAAPGPSRPLRRPALESPPAARSDARKVVTIVFADLAGSTALHERLDPESVRRFMEGYYRAMRAAVDAHGGTRRASSSATASWRPSACRTVAEDDAIRAVRAGMDMQQAFRELARAEHAGSAHRPARRHQHRRGGRQRRQHATSRRSGQRRGAPAAGGARRRCRDRRVDAAPGRRRCVTLEPLGSFALKGRAEQVEAYRVVSLERPTGVGGRGLRRARRGAGHASPRVYDAAVAQRRRRASRCCSARRGSASRA